MNHYPLFENMPVLSMITNFSRNGNFERIYMVMQHNPENQPKNEKRKPKSVTNQGSWNGPGFRP